MCMAEKTNSESQLSLITPEMYFIFAKLQIYEKTALKHDAIAVQ